MVGEGEYRSGSFQVLRGELGYACLCAFEFADADGPFGGDERVREMAIKGIEQTSERFDRKGRVLDGGSPSTYFTLVPMTRGLLSLKEHVDGAWLTGMVGRAEQLFSDAAERTDRTHDYLNPRALEGVGCLGLYRLTGDTSYMDRCIECLDELLKRQYPCGALPYHTGTWIWGRRPSQGYQFLCATLMLYLGRELGREDAIEAVRRVMEYSLLATNRRAEAFVTTFEGLHKARTSQCAGRQWVAAAALGDERFRNLARTTYEIWASQAVESLEGASDKPARMRSRFGTDALIEALHLGIRTEPEGGAFVPTPGTHAMEDISTVFVHEEQLDVAMSVLSGYSAFAEADCGNVKLYALTCELTDSPTFRNAGTDALRGDWRTPTEQIECFTDGRRSVLKGWVYTKWENDAEKDFARVHNRRLEVSMSYENSELLLEYQTIWNHSPEPVPSRLLFLLIARPPSEPPRLKIGKEMDVKTPPADSEEEFFTEAAVDTVRFGAPDSSAIEIIPELTLADRVIAERPPRTVTSRPDSTKGARQASAVRPANEGSLRLAFEGPNVLEKGRYRIRFIPSGTGRSEKGR